MTLIEFKDIFNPLAVRLRFADADEATIRTYYPALDDLDVELVAMAAERFARSPGDNDSWFPRTPEWRSMVATIERERLHEQRERLRRLHLAGQVACRDCEDTGFRSIGDRVERCPCRRERRLEILGRRPMLALPSAHETAELDQSVMERIRTMLRPIVQAKRMPSPLVTSDFIEAAKGDPILTEELNRLKGVPTSDEAV